MFDFASHDHFHYVSKQEQIALATVSNSSTLLVSTSGSIDIDQQAAIYAQKVKAQFADGFQIGDIPAVLEDIFALTDQVTDLATKKALIIKTMDQFIDITDTPYLPDSLTDPIFKEVGACLVNAVFRFLETQNNLTVSSSTGGTPANQIEVFLNKEIALFQDGFQLKDLFDTLALSVQIVDQFSSLDAQQKKDSVVYILDKIIDNTDTPYLPDSLTDPLLKQLIPPLIDFFMELKNHAAASTKSSTNLSFSVKMKR